MAELVSAIIAMNEQVLVCPAGAIAESHRETGRLELGIAATKDAAPDVDFPVIDSPPGTSCPVIESVRGSDFVSLVTEPTPFGPNDLKLAVEMVRALKLPFAVAINRADVGNGRTKRYCEHQRIDVPPWMIWSVRPPRIRMASIAWTIPGATGAGGERTTSANRCRRRAMPIFEYRCTKCGHVTEFLEKRNARQRHKCGKCGSKVTEKVFSTFASKSGSSSSSSSSCPTGTCPLS